MNKGAYEVITKIKVAGIKFTFSNSNTALIWKDGQFFEMADAHNNGIITKENLKELAKKVNQINQKGIYPRDIYPNIIAKSRDCFFSRGICMARVVGFEPTE